MLSTIQHIEIAKEIPTVTKIPSSKILCLKIYNCKKLKNNIPKNIIKEFFCIGSISNISFIMKSILNMSEQLQPTIVYAHCCYIVYAYC